MEIWRKNGFVRSGTTTSRSRPTSRAGSTSRFRSDYVGPGAVFGLRVYAINDGGDRAFPRPAAGCDVLAAGVAGRRIRQLSTARRHPLDFSYEFTDLATVAYYNAADALIYGRDYALARPRSRGAEIIKQITVMVQSANTFYDPIRALDAHQSRLPHRDGRPHGPARVRALPRGAAVDLRASDRDRAMTAATCSSAGWRARREPGLRLDGRLRQLLRAGGRPLPTPTREARRSIGAGSNVCCHDARATFVLPPARADLIRTGRVARGLRRRRALGSDRHATTRRLRACRPAVRQGRA